MSDPFIAEIVMFGGNFAPRGWALCDGQLLSIAQNSALFSILGTTYGGDGRTSFGLPDLRGRSPVHPGTGPGLNNVRLGEKGGRETVTLVEQNLPAHSHTFAQPCVNNAGGDETSPAGSSFPVSTDDVYYSGTPNAAMAAGDTGNSGGSQAFDVRSPYQGVNFIIALVGIFPSRN